MPYNLPDEDISTMLQDLDPDYALDRPDVYASNKKFVLESQSSHNSGHVSLKKADKSYSCLNYVGGDCVETPTSQPNLLIISLLHKLGLGLDAYITCLGLDKNTALNLLDGKVGITPDIANKLEILFDISQQDWLRLNADYEYSQRLGSLRPCSYTPTIHELLQSVAK